MTSQGQRFRRRALRRGYKVDEVDTFLDRVEATLSSASIGAPVTAQEVHDVVFRVRFGGYDEWQVDLHLDRVERQLTEMEEQPGARPATSAGFGAREPSRPAASPLDRTPPLREERPAAPPLREEPLAPPPLPLSSPAAGGATETFGRYEEPSFTGGGYNDFGASRHGKSDMTSEIRMPESGFGAPPSGGGAAGGGGAMLSGDAARVDQLRHTFQVRRFGSGYDRSQVDRLFDGLVDAMSSRSPLPISDADLDPSQFQLVSGGYFEGEVDAALREVRDIVARRR